MVIMIFFHNPYKVAFSAALPSGFTVAGSSNLNVVFSEVITNVGEAYNGENGFFTAPVRGVYYLRFSVMDLLNTRTMNIWLHKNGEQLMWLTEYGADGQPGYLSSGLALQLEKGDAVNLVLPASMRLWNWERENQSTFSGFLLFPL
ncbi:cerebellin-1-like [Engraulis encrasicolus]|uniref:cerebellin-1-like n=1 Tax=Engraulis encrasicolus TaxID=184585 RepID=UPI002FD1BA28